jgi:hypothetical protein
MFFVPEREMEGKLERFTWPWREPLLLRRLSRLRPVDSSSFARRKSMSEERGTESMIASSSVPEKEESRWCGWWW